MPIQTTPTLYQAVDYLTATASIPAHQMSRSMYGLLNSCARVVQRQHPGMAGWYDPEDIDSRIDLSKHLHWQARPTEIIPQSAYLQTKTMQAYPDPLDAFLDNFFTA